jgi:hypothetical protein
MAADEFQVFDLSEDHFCSAGRLLGRYRFTHRLRTLDALQLAIAVDLKHQGQLDQFVVSDKALGEVATGPSSGIGCSLCGSQRLQNEIQRLKEILAEHAIFMPVAKQEQPERQRWLPVPSEVFQLGTLTDNRAKIARLDHYFVGAKMSTRNAGARRMGLGAIAQRAHQRMMGTSHSTTESSYYRK